MQAAAPRGPASAPTHVFVLHVLEKAQLAVGSLGEELRLKRAVQLLYGHFGTGPAIDSRASGSGNRELGERGPRRHHRPRTPQGWHTRPALSHSLCLGTLLVLRHTLFPQTHSFCPGTLPAQPSARCPTQGTTCTHPPGSPRPGTSPGDCGDPRGAPSRAGSVAGPPGSPPPEQVGSKQPGNKAKSAAGCAPPRLPPAPSLGWGGGAALPLPVPLPLPLPAHQTAP